MPSIPSAALVSKRNRLNEGGFASAIEISGGGVRSAGKSACAGHAGASMAADDGVEEGAWQFEPGARAEVQPRR